MISTWKSIIRLLSYYIFLFQHVFFVLFILTIFFIEKSSNSFLWIMENLINLFDLKCN